MRNVLTPPIRKRFAWDARLAAYLERWRGRPFAWGTADCGHFVAGALGAMTTTPTSVLLDSVPPYSCLAGAIRTLRSFRIVGRLQNLGLEPVTAGLAFVQRGDILLVENEGLESVGVAWDRDVWTTHPGCVCGPAPLEAALPGAIVLRVTA